MFDFEQPLPPVSLPGKELMSPAGTFIFVAVARPVAAE